MSRSYNRKSKTRKAYQTEMKPIIEEREREIQMWEKRRKVQKAAPAIFITVTLVTMFLFGLFCSNKEIVRMVFEYIGAGTLLAGGFTYLKAMWGQDEHWQYIAFTLILGAPVIFFGARVFLK